MALTSHPRVFLSYARRDGEAFATALRRRLTQEQPEITLWQDRAEMEGGVGWWAQIEAALDQVNFLIIVLTPQALASEMTRKEWRYARQRGVNVYPVKGVPDDRINYDTLPNWMRKAHFFDVGQWTGETWTNVKEWETFVNYLKSDRQPPRIPFLAPDLADGFVSRVRELEELVRLVLAPDQTHPTAITTALHGSGGYGKTTLATALCHDPRVLNAFDDGVLWTSLGQQPKVHDELARWYDALTGSRPAFLDVADASVKLAGKLGDRQCLLVIDDVWDRRHLEPFLKGGPRCARVVTTRRLDLLAGAPRVRVDEMTRSEAVQLLQTALGAAAIPAERLEPLTKRLGEWPLLLKLTVGMLQSRLNRGDSLGGALGYVERLLDKHGVVAFDARDAARREEAVNRTVLASRSDLEPVDDRRFLDLAIFPEDEAIPLTTLERLWNVDDLDTEGCAQRLDDRALLKLDLTRGVITLHDVMRAYLLLQGDTTAVHARLVAAYGNVLDLPDSYSWRWLPFHMGQAGQREALRALLLRPEWLQMQGHRVGPYAQLQAFEWAKDMAVLAPVRDALRLAMPALAADPSQICEQLLGRLPADAEPDIQRFKSRLEAIAPVPRLHARWPNLAGLGSLVQTLPHEGVHGVLPLPDRRLLSWSEDGTLWVWDVATGEGRALTGHKVIGALRLPDGRVLSWSRSTLRVWDVATGEGGALTGHNGGVTGALLLPDGRVVSWSRDHTLRVWNVATGESRTLTGHEDWVTGALRLPDGRVLSWSRDHTLRVWDVATGEGRALIGHEGGVTGALLLPDGCVVSWSRDHTLRVWNVATGEGRALTGHEGGVTGALLLPDGRVLSWSGDTTPPRVWDVATGEGRALTGHRVKGALLLPDGRVVSWSRDRTLQVWDVATGEGRALTGHLDGVTDALLLRDGRLLSWSGDGTLRVWDVATGESRALTGHERRVKSALLLRDERVLSWSGDGTLRVWDVATGESRALTGHEDWVTGALRLPDGRVLSWSSDHTLRVWDVASGKGRALTGHENGITGALLLPDGRALSRSRDSTLRVWDVATGESRALIGHKRVVTGALLLPDGRVLSWSGDSTLRVWDVATGESRALTGHERRVKSALLLRDERVLSWSGDGTLRVWDVATGEGRALTGHKDGVGGALVLPDGRVVSWSSDHTLRVWDVATGGGWALTGHKRRVIGALRLPDGCVLSWSEDSTLRVWDVATGESRALIGHKAGVKGASRLRDGRVLSWSSDGTLRVWDAATGEGRVLTGHEREVTRALRLRDGRVVSWSADGTLRVWDVATGEGRTLTGHEPEVLGALPLADGCLLTWGGDRSLRRHTLRPNDSGEAFYFDARVTTVLLTGPDTFFVGDALGRVHFLKRVVASMVPLQHGTT